MSTLTDSVKHASYHLQWFIHTASLFNLQFDLSFGKQEVKFDILCRHCFKRKVFIVFLLCFFSHNNIQVKWIFLTCVVSVFRLSKILFARAYCVNTPPPPPLPSGRVEHAGRQQHQQHCKPEKAASITRALNGQSRNILQFINHPWRRSEDFYVPFVNCLVEWQSSLLVNIAK